MTDGQDDKQTSDIDSSNAHVISVLAARLDSMELGIKGVKLKVDEVLTKIAVLEERSKRYEKDCHKAVEITRALNGAVRAEAKANKAVDMAVENRVSNARIAALSAGGGAGGVAIVVALVRFLGIA